MALAGGNTTPKREVKESLRKILGFLPGAMLFSAEQGNANPKGLAGVFRGGAVPPCRSCKQARCSHYPSSPFHLLRSHLPPQFQSVPLIFFLFHVGFITAWCTQSYHVVSQITAGCCDWHRGVNSGRNAVSPRYQKSRLYDVTDPGRCRQKYSFKRGLCVSPASAGWVVCKLVHGVQTSGAT